ncbi:hypothetical protein GJ496_004105 [Pomphorhynchus laevis]|nr:hypothetical protein GJ496_004105 [Pomphorhynchus laevis]
MVKRKVNNAHGCRNLAVKTRKKGEVDVPSGTVLVDVRKNNWRLGSAFARGGFGMLYKAAKSPSNQEQFVCKIEPKSNGPIFCEIHFYLRTNDQVKMTEFMHQHNLVHLGVPVMQGHGQNEDHRFLIMNKYGENMEKSSLLVDNILLLACQLIYILEYIHSFGYTHNDVKASNIVMDLNDKRKVYLIDFGLTNKFRSNTSDHIPMKIRPKCMHDGTIDYTSLDAHNGIQGSRRSDLEILFYNLIDWLSGGKLPWRPYIQNADKIKQMKLDVKNNPDDMLSQCLKNKLKPKAIIELKKFANHIYELGYDQCPNYELCRTHLLNIVQIDKIKFNGLLLSSVNSDTLCAVNTKSTTRGQENHFEMNSHCDIGNPIARVRKRNARPFNRSIQTDE